jgi:hypothetical protein
VIQGTNERVEVAGKYQDLTTICAVAAVEVEECRDDLATCARTAWRCSERGTIVSARHRQTP